MFNLDTLPLAVLEAMQYGNDLERILHEILLANPAHGPVQLNKTELSNGFYHMDLNTNDVPNLGVVLTTKTSTETMPCVAHGAEEQLPCILHSFGNN